MPFMISAVPSVSTALNFGKTKHLDCAQSALKKYSTPELIADVQNGVPMLISVSGKITLKIRVKTKVLLLLLHEIPLYITSLIVIKGPHDPN